MERTFGLVFHPSFPIETLPDYAREAEALGFDELWLWDDCFLPGAFTASALALAATRKIKVCIGLLPAPVYNPLFAAMEITTLTKSFPGRFIPGFGHGVVPWMKQIGAASKPSLDLLEETVTSVRSLLAGDEVTFHGKHVNLDQVKMTQVAGAVPPIYIGAMREKSLQLSGRIGDGTIFTSMSSPQYIRWASRFIQDGLDTAGRTSHRNVAFLDVKVNPDGQMARAATRRSLAERLPWADIHISTLDYADEMNAFLASHNADELALSMPDRWLDNFAACGTPRQGIESMEKWFEAGIDTVIVQPLWGDRDCLAEYARYLMPVVRSQRAG